MARLLLIALQCRSCRHKADDCRGLGLESPRAEILDFELRVAAHAPHVSSLECLWLCVHMPQARAVTAELFLP